MAHTQRSKVTSRTLRVPTTAKHALEGENGAGNEVRTRDLNLGKVALYQLSYSRVALIVIGVQASSTGGALCLLFKR